MQGIFGGTENTRTSHNVNPHKKITHTINNKHLPKKEKDIHVVLVHALWCGHCKALMPEWKKMTKQVKRDRKLDAKCKVVTIEMNQQDAELPKYKEMIGNKDIDIPGYPTIFFVKNGMLNDYTGGRNSAELVDWIRNSANKKDMTVGGNDYGKMSGGQKTRRRRRTQKCSTCKSGFLFNLFGK